MHIGSFRAAVDHPRFHDSGPIQQPLFVFPRTSVVIRHEGRRPFVVDTRTVTYYNVGQRYTRRRVDPRGDVCEWFSVREDVLRGILARHDPAVADREAELFPFRRGPSDSRSYALQRLVVRHVIESEASDGLLVDESVLHILGRLAALGYASIGRRAGDAAAGSIEGDESSLARRVRAYVLERFTDRVALDDIAGAVHASVFHLCRVFKREVGTTIHRYREELRLRRSLELIPDSRNLSALALELGYSSHSHLTASFRRAFSMTPSQFRERASSRRIRELAAKLSA